MEMDGDNIVVLNSELIKDESTVVPEHVVSLSAVFQNEESTPSAEGYSVNVVLALEDEELDICVTGTVEVKADEPCTFCGQVPHD
jgi:hypothetical protein